MDDDQSQVSPPPVPPLPTDRTSLDNAEWSLYDNPASPPQSQTTCINNTQQPSSSITESLSKESSKARQNELRRKLVLEDMKWAKRLTLADVIYDKDHPVPLSRLGTKSTALHSIGSIETVGLSVDKLRAFCTAQKIAKWAKKTKEEVCDLIVDTAIMRQQIADRTRQLLDTSLSHTHANNNEEDEEVAGVGVGSVVETVGAHAHSHTCIDINTSTQEIDLDWAKRQLMSSVVVDPSHLVLVSKSSKARTSLISIGGVEVIRLSTELLKAFCGEHGISRARKDKEDLCKDIASAALAARGVEGMDVVGVGMDGGVGVGESGATSPNEEMVGGGFVAAVAPSSASHASHNGLRTPIISSLYRSNLAGSKRLRLDDATAIRSDIQSLKTTLEENVTTRRPHTEAQEQRERFETYKSMLTCHVQLKQTIRDLEGKIHVGNRIEEHERDMEADIELYRAQTKKMEEEISSFSFPPSSEIILEDSCAAV